MLPVERKAQCCGCQACASVCPVGCISMLEDEEGFLYPEIDIQQCIGCNRCKTVCPALQQLPAKEQQDLAFAAKAKNDGIRKTSSSGGIFSLLARQVCQQGGAVFGAAFQENWKLCHICGQTMEECEPMKGSKYLQSDTNHMYPMVKEYLEEGKHVLFSGTPCQVNGLQLYLGKQYDTLLLVDFICHGVSSPKAYQNYCKEQEQRHGAAITKVSFRDKEKGWKRFSMSLDFSNGAVYKKLLTEDGFLRGFLSNLFLRPSCHNCPNNGNRRLSDITLADYWGAKAELDDDKGTSFVVVHSDKGKALFSAIAPEMDTTAIRLEDGVRHNTCYYKSVPPHKKRAVFFERLDTVPFSDLVAQCTRETILARGKKQVKSVLVALKHKLMP